jgi:hypothetical protein
MLHDKNIVYSSVLPCDETKKVTLPLNISTSRSL